MFKFHHIGKILSAFLFTGCSVSVPPDIKPVDQFDISKYLGTWYEIARLDHSFEKGLNNVKAAYSLKENGDVKVVNSGFNPIKGKWSEAIGTAKFLGEPDTGALKVSFFGPFYGGYNIVKLDEHYQYAVIVGSSLKYFWILSRTPTISENLKQELLTVAYELNIDTQQLIWVNQDKNLEH
ncbi:lipocalin family protein [Zophobihabitans entericus]|uniref:Outer membrane lipoprotein Blc n=1 Tax=Zophobihabitans entericus TaxID=1635327 RepID=A0A6G9IEU0_9GAMM|nr:lipocalin family protein [Zophobihabitans entericus]QIQ22110.1 hypothetical protein IPMB12_10675 [Zophobihabitans entericus]